MCFHSSMKIIFQSLLFGSSYGVNAFFMYLRCLSAAVQTFPAIDLESICTIAETCVVRILEKTNL